MRQRSAPYLSLANFLLFCVFVGCIWAFSVVPSWSQGRVGETEVQMVMLQAVSLLLLIGAYQMSSKKEGVWRIVLFALSFVALSQSSLLAFLSPAA